MTESKIYLGADGAYHDDTEANRELFPAAEDVAPEEQAEGVPGETAPDAGTTIETDDSGTLTEAGEDAGSDGPPVTTEPAPVPEAPTAQTVDAKPAKNSTK